MARPKKKASEIRSKTIKSKVTASEKKEIKTYAIATGKDEAEIVRNVTLEKVRGE